MPRHARRHPSPRAVRAIGLGAGVVLGGALVAAAAVPLASGAPALTLALRRAPHGDPVVRLPFPSEGEAAVGIPSFGVSYASPDERPVPIASLTKLMVAYVTLHALPLRGQATGPTWVVTPADEQVFKDDVATDQSSVKVVAGEVLDERELLEGALVHSANNYATMLGELVAGTDDAMVADMNATAAQLGLRATSYADVSGFDPASVSTAADQLRLATLLMADPVFASIVDTPSVVLPVAGVVTTYTPLLGIGGVVGVKSGFTSQAGGCDVMARELGVGGRKVLVMAVSLGQSSTKRAALVAAGHASLVLTAAVGEHLRGFVVTLAHHAAGELAWPGHGVAVVATRTILVPAFSASPPTVVVRPVAWGANHVAAGTVVAFVVVTSGAVREATPLVTTASLTRPSLWERLR